MDVNWVAVLNFAVSETSKKLVKLFFAENSLSPAIQNSLNNISMPINPIKLSFVTKKIEINEEHKRIASSAEAGWGISLRNQVLEKKSNMKANGQRNRWKGNWENKH